MNITVNEIKNQRLQRGLNDYYSAPINMSYYIVIDFIIKDNQIIPIDIGVHNKVC